MKVSFLQDSLKRLLQCLPPMFSKLFECRLEKTVVGETTGTKRTCQEILEEITFYPADMREKSSEHPILRFIADYQKNQRSNYPVDYGENISFSICFT